MTMQQFSDAVLEDMFVRGWNCVGVSLFLHLIEQEWSTHGDRADLAHFTERCMQYPGLFVLAGSPLGDGSVCTTAGASERWLGVHEAGHAIVALQAGFVLRGVRFYGSNGFPGETGTDESDWRNSRNEDLLRRLIRVDVAGPVAESLSPNCTTNTQLPSTFFDDRATGNRPTDFISAESRTRILSRILLAQEGRTLNLDAVWDTSRRAVEQAESEAEAVLRANAEAMERLGDRLMHGPLTGAEVRALVGVLA